MKKIHIRRIIYHLRTRYLTMNNVVVGIGLLIGASWAWGSIEVMQRNYNLQKQLDAKVRQQTVVQLESQNLALQQTYYKSAEYQELAVRERLGLANAGEKVLVLPPNTQTAKNADVVKKSTIVTPTEPVSNLQQWMDFLFGAHKQ